MNECKYIKNAAIKYYDFEKKYLPYKCHNSVLPNSTHCKFHDIVYANANPEAVMDSFYKLVNDAVQYSKPLFCIGYKLVGRVSLLDREFNNCVYFSHAVFNNEADFTFATFKGKANFSLSEFESEAEFIQSIFPYNITKDATDAPIEFHYSTFRKRARFIGTANDQLELGLVSFKGVELSNAEFHNVKWSREKGFLITRNIIIDEKLVGESRNYEDIAKIYNQLRKNYESRLLFNEASHFFVGEMEAIRKSLYRRGAKKGEIAESIRNRVTSIG